MNAKRSHRAHQAAAHRVERVVLVALTVFTGLVLGGPADGADSPCLVVDVATDAASSVVFVDGFEAGDLSGWSHPGAAFSATEIIDVHLQAHFDQTPVGTHLLELQVFNPNGNLYRTLTAPVTADPGRRGAMVTVEEFPHPLAVHEMGSTALSSLELRLPVAGTNVVTYSLYGRWRVEPYLDGRPAACGGPTWFHLVQ